MYMHSYVLFYVTENLWPITVREEHTLKMSENRGLRGIFKLKRE
jgi:hypothetical protein